MMCGMRKLASSFGEKGVTQLGVREYLARRMGMMDEWQKLLKEEEADTD